MSGFDEFIRITKEKYPNFHKYNSIYMAEAEKIGCSLATSTSATGPIPEVKTYNSKIISIEEEAERQLKESLENYWGLKQDEQGEP
jgi:hypothetical protein